MLPYIRLGRTNAGWRQLCIGSKKCHLACICHNTLVCINGCHDHRMVYTCLYTTLCTGHMLPYIRLGRTNAGWRQLCIGSKKCHLACICHNTLVCINGCHDHRMVYTCLYTTLCTGHMLPYISASRAALAEPCLLARRPCLPWSLP